MGNTSLLQSQTERVTMYTTLFSILFLLVGLLLGVVFNDRYREYVNWNTHEYDKLIKENPHPELFDKKGKLFNEDYLNVEFPLDYDPSIDHMGPGEFGDDGDDGDDDYVYSDD